MKINEGTIDRVIRVALGVALAYIGWTLGGGVWSIVLYVLAALLLVTGAVGFCPVYRVLGNLTTARKK
jgi:hypothetical protein